MYGNAVLRRRVGAPQWERWLHNTLVPALVFPPLRWCSLCIIFCLCLYFLVITRRRAAWWGSLLFTSPARLLIESLIHEAEVLSTESLGCTNRRAAAAAFINTHMQTKTCARAPTPSPLTPVNLCAALQTSAHSEVNFVPPCAILISLPMMFLLKDRVRTDLCVKGTHPFSCCLIASGTRTLSPLLSNLLVQLWAKAPPHPPLPLRPHNLETQPVGCFLFFIFLQFSFSLKHWI